MEIVADFVTGHLSEINSTLRRKVGQYTRYYTYIYIGATSNPKARATYWKKYGWSKLVILWRTTSYQQAKNAESKLIKWASDELAYEQRDGGGGLSPGKENYFIYILVSD